MNDRSGAGLAMGLALLFVGLILIGCAPAAAPPAPSPTVSPTQTNVRAQAAPVHVARTDKSQTDVTKDQSVTVGLDDLIVVPEPGHGILNVGTAIETDIYRSSELVLTDARTEPGNAIFAKFDQPKGCGKVALQESGKVRVRFDTAFGTINTLEPGTEFVICHDPATLTCLVVLKGQVEVLAQGKVTRTKAGEATYILKDKPPSPAICAHLDEISLWTDQKEGTGKVTPLGKIVAGWKQESCAAATASAPQVASATASQTPRSSPVPLPPSQGMVKIPAGTYTIGSATQDNNHIAPMQKKLPAFWIDAHEVTNGQYQAFLDATAHATPVAWPGKQDFPVAGVTWDDAAAFCTWANKRLPSEAEWEVAARGPGPNPPLYPWGDDPLAGGKIDNLPLTGTYQAGSMAFNVSHFGVYDMAGNVWEWVGEPYYPVTEGMKILRGGRYGLIEDMAYRQQAEPANPRFVAVAGFRCATDKVQGE